MYTSLLVLFLAFCFVCVERAWEQGYLVAMVLAYHEQTVGSLLLSAPTVQLVNA